MALSIVITLLMLFEQRNLGINIAYLINFLKGENCNKKCASICQEQFYFVDLMSF